VIAIKAIQEQQAIIDSQKSDIKELKNLIEQLSKKIFALSFASTTNATAQSNTIVSSYLKQNTPNPFSVSTVINYNIPENKNAIIEIASVNGQLMRTYPVQQKGNGKLIIDAGTLKPGIYYYTLKLNGEEVDSKQMMIVK